VRIALRTSGSATLPAAIIAWHFDLMPAATIAQIQSSHLEANVPDHSDFDRFLKRDLVAYFSDKFSGPTSVEYELLRKAPTQAGTAFTKYYVWVRVSANGAIRREGAARVAAIGRERFEVTDFLAREEIRPIPPRSNRCSPGPCLSALKSRSSTDWATQTRRTVET